MTREQAEREEELVDEYAQKVSDIIEQHLNTLPLSEKRRIIQRMLSTRYRENN